MVRSIQSAFVAALFATLSLYLWRITYPSTDFAVLAVIPLAFVLGVGIWSLVLDPWKARLRVELREDSPFARLLTGKIRTAFLTIGFTTVTVTLLSWQALRTSAAEAAVMLAAFVISASVFTTVQAFIARHLHQPFARVVATALTTWLVALPFAVIIAYTTWAWATVPGAMLGASLSDAVQIGLAELPERGGRIADILSVPYAYEAAKLWVVVQMQDYPIVGALFSIDAALISVILTRSAIVITHVIEQHIMKVPE